MNDGTLVIRTLGAFDVFDSGGRSIFAAAARAQQPLLKLLLSTRGLEIESAVAAKILWPGTEPQLGLTNVRKAVFVLRKALESANASDVVITKGGRVRLDASRCDVDVIRLLEAPLSSVATVAEAARHLQTADHTFLPADRSLQWTEPRREAAHARRVADACLGLEIASAEPDSWAGIEIETIADRLAADDIDDPGLALALARYHVALGRRVEALDVLDRFARSFEDDEPSIRALRETIVQSRPIDPDLHLATFSAIGRDTERNFALGRFAGLAAGNGGTIVLSGPPGIGTSKLANDVARALAGRAGAVPLVAGDVRTTDDLARALQSLLAVAPAVANGIVPSVAAVLAEAVPALAEQAQPGIAPSSPQDAKFAFALERAFRQAAGHAPLAIVADITNASASAREALVKLAAASATAPLAVIFTLRSFGFENDVRRALAPHVSLIELGPLARGDAYDLIATYDTTATIEPALAVEEAGTHPGALVHVLARTERALDATYAAAYLAALEEELPPAGIATFRALARDRADSSAPNDASESWLALLRSRGLFAGEEAPELCDRTIERCLEIRGDRTRRPLVRVTEARLAESLRRADALVREGRLRTACALLESDDDDAVLGNDAAAAVRAAAARARVLALLEDPERATRALAFARVRAKATATERLSESVELAAAEIWLWRGNREMAFRCALAAGSSLEAVSIVARTMPASDERLAEARAALERAVDIAPASSPALPAALVARAACANDSRVAAEAARRCATLLDEGPVTTEAFSAAIDLATLLAVRREREAGRSIARTLRRLADALDVPLFQTRARALPAIGS